MGIQSGRRCVRSRRGSNSRFASILVGAALLTVVAGGKARAVTPDSPEVQKLVDGAVGYLEKNTDERLGAKCLIGLVFVKLNRPDHPRVREALDECRKQMAANPPDA